MILNPLNYCFPCRHKLFGQATDQPLSNFESQKSWKYEGITKPCTHLKPAPSTSNHLHLAPSTTTQLISKSTQLHPPSPSSFQPEASSLEHPQQYLNQNVAHNWRISPKFMPKEWTLSFLTENWHTSYIGGVDSESTHTFLKFRPQKFILGEIWAQKFKVVRFLSKLVHLVSQRFWFWIQT